MKYVERVSLENVVDFLIIIQHLQISYISKYLSLRGEIFAVLLRTVLSGIRKKLLRNNSVSYFKEITLYKRFLIYGVMRN